jgi:hypothetical protein
MDITNIVIWTLVTPIILILLFIVVRVIPTVLYCQFYKVKKIIIHSV